MSAIGKKKGLLEVFKFGTYIAIPVVMMYAFANNSDNLEKIIRNVSTPPLSHFKREQWPHVLGLVWLFCS